MAHVQAKTYFPRGLYAGIDLSLRSPAMVVYYYPGQDEGSEAHIIAFCRTKTQDKKVANNTFKVTCNTSLHMHSRLVDLPQQQAINEICTITRTQLSNLARKYQCIVRHIFMENYAFGKFRGDGNSRSTSVLAEVAGVIKNMCYEHNWPVTLIPPPTVKKIFCGQGRATKEDMYKAYIQHGYPDCCPYILCKPSNGPHEDIVDAIAVLFTGLSQDKAQFINNID
jgi:Holliday junction resolvasome RuvABC endonuclease subunit